MVLSSRPVSCLSPITFYTSREHEANEARSKVSHGLPWQYHVIVTWLESHYWLGLGEYQVALNGISCRSLRAICSTLIRLISLCSGLIIHDSSSRLPVQFLLFYVPALRSWVRNTIYSETSTLLLSTARGLSRGVARCTRVCLGVVHHMCMIPAAAASHADLSLPPLY